MKQFSNLVDLHKNWGSPDDEDVVVGVLPTHAQVHEPHIVLIHQKVKDYDYTCDVCRVRCRGRRIAYLACPYQLDWSEEDQDYYDEISREGPFDLCYPCFRRCKIWFKRSYAEGKQSITIIRRLNGQGS